MKRTTFRKAAKAPTNKIELLDEKEVGELTSLGGVKQLTSLRRVKLRDESKVDRGFDLDNEENGISYLSTMARLTKMVM